jgi:hypothetical protein
MTGINPLAQTRNPKTRGKHNNMPSISDFAKAKIASLPKFTPFLKPLPEGATHLTLLVSVPTENVKYKGRVNVAVVKDSKEYTWSVGGESPLFRDLLAIYETMSDQSVDIIVERKGLTATNTRYIISKA